MTRCWSLTVPHEPMDCEDADEKYDNTRNERIWTTRTKVNNVLKRIMCWEFVLKTIETILLAICAALYSQLNFVSEHTNVTKLYPNVILMIFLTIALIRMISIVFSWQISLVLMITLNSLAAILIGGAGGVSLHVWFYDPYIGRYTITSGLLLTETVLSLITPFVYLLDLILNLNKLHSV